ncbi:layilin LAYN mRNA [Crotalus adamanteus]|uniref:Cilia- and flagella-associated protein HOATZ n=1 Tax=Crotalus adamanteus TaxID=8729 RepID=A0AAW1AZ55_CROAD
MENEWDGPEENFLVVGKEDGGRAEEKMVLFDSSRFETVPAFHIELPRWLIPPELYQDPLFHVRAAPPPQGTPVGGSRRGRSGARGRRPNAAPPPSQRQGRPAGAARGAMETERPPTPAPSAMATAPPAPAPSPSPAGSAAAAPLAFAGSSDQDVALAKSFWNSVTLQPPLESRLGARCGSLCDGAASQRRSSTGTRGGPGGKEGGKEGAAGRRESRPGKAARLPRLGLRSAGEEAQRGGRGPRCPAWGRGAIAATLGIRAA